jgi:plasmid stabilization system protein ParE
VSYRVRLTPEAEEDLLRLFDFVLERELDGGRDGSLAGEAIGAIRRAMRLLETFPFTCRKVHPHNTFVRELVIPFGSAGYVALFEIVDDGNVAIAAVRHHREDDYL